MVTATATETPNGTHARTEQPRPAARRNGPTSRSARSDTDGAPSHAPAAPPSPYVAHSSKALDAIISATAEEIGRAVSGRDADGTWIDSMARDLAAARRERAARCGHSGSGAGALATLPAFEPNPYLRHSLAEMDALIAAKVDRLARLAVDSGDIDDPNGFIAAQARELAAMRQAAESRGDVGAAPAGARQTTPDPDGAAAERPAGDVLLEILEGRASDKGNVTTYSESGACGFTFALRYHLPNAGADFPAATATVLIPEYGAEYERPELTAGAKAMLEDAFRAAMTGELPAQYAAMDSD